MGYRTQPSAAQMLEVMRHLADVTALKGDPAAQRRLLVDGLSRLFGTTLGWIYVIDGCRPGQPLRPVCGELASGLDPAWLRYCADFAVHVPATSDPYADNAIRSDEAEQQWITSRVLPDPAAHRRYAPAVEAMKDARIGDGAVCAFRTGPGGDRLTGFSLHRCRDDPRMRPQDYALHRFALAEIRRLHDRGHLPSLIPPPESAPPPPVSAAGQLVVELPPRQREVLDGLLKGHAPKSIAHNLNLSVWTVRDHIKQLHARFEVHGRDELMARFVNLAGTVGR